MKAFFQGVWNVLVEVFNTLKDLWIGFYNWITGFLYRYLPEPVANIFLIMIGVIIVGIVITKFIKDAGKN